jgi:hypothetical protein
MLDLRGKASVSGAPGGLLRYCTGADGPKNSGRGNCMCPSRLLIVWTTIALPATKTASSGSGGPPRSNQPRTFATRASLATSISWCQRSNTRRSCLDSSLTPLILRRPTHHDMALDSRQLHTSVFISTTHVRILATTANPFRRLDPAHGQRVPVLPRNQPGTTLIVLSPLDPMRIPIPGWSSHKQQRPRWQLQLPLLRLSLCRLDRRRRRWRRCFSRTTE